MSFRTQSLFFYISITDYGLKGKFDLFLDEGSSGDSSRLSHLYRRHEGEYEGAHERCTIVSLNNGDLFRRKVGAAVIAVRRAGSTHVLSSMKYFFLLNQMVVPGSCYRNMAIGRNFGEVKNDAEGIQTMKTLGQNMAWLIKKIYS